MCEILGSKPRFTVYSMQFKAQFKPFASSKVRKKKNGFIYSPRNSFSLPSTVFSLAFTLLYTQTSNMQEQSCKKNIHRKVNYLEVMKGIAWKTSEKAASIKENVEANREKK